MASQIRSQFIFRIYFQNLPLHLKVLFSTQNSSKSQQLLMAQYLKIKLKLFHRNNILFAIKPRYLAMKYFQFFNNVGSFLYVLTFCKGYRFSFYYIIECRRHRMAS